jgi:hypothetical protein
MRFLLLIMLLFALFTQTAGFLGMFRTGRSRRRARRRSRSPLNIHNPTNTTINATFRNETVFREL